MPGHGDFSDVVRGVQSRGTNADARSIGELLDRAWAERTAGANAPPPTQAEIAEVQRLLDNPAISDNFSPSLRENLQSFVRGDVRPAPQTVANLVPDMERLTQARNVAGRFASDFVLVKEQLLEQRGLSASDKANRAFEFFARYAERFVTLATGSSGLGAQGDGSQNADTGGGAFDPTGNRALFEAREGLLSPQERSEEVGKFLEHLKSFGFLQLIESRSGKDALTVAKELLAAKSPREFERKTALIAFDAPAWEQPRSYAQGKALPSAALEQHAAAEAASKQARHGISGKTAALNAQAALAAAKARPELDSVPGRPDLVKVNPMSVDPAKIPVQVKPEVKKRDEKGEALGLLSRLRNKVLGPNMMWNFLHRYRKGADADEEGHIGPDPIDKLAFGAVMALLGLALVAVALVLIF